MWKAAGTNGFRLFCFKTAAKGDPRGVWNWLLNIVGKQLTSFIVLDLMRLPLGILTGVGFIGGGAILKRGESVSGLTTAATLWFVTVIGLVFGGGQLWLGAGGAVLGYGILHGLRRSSSG